MDDKTIAAVDWLLSSAEPAVRLLARRDLLGEGVLDTHEMLDGGLVRALLSGQREDGGFGVHPYRKWTGAHWRLVSLVELGIPAGEPRAVRAAGTVLDWLTGEQHRASIVAIDGLPRVHASQEGNALAVCSRLGLARDPRVQLLAESLIRWQWPDGGWNCDRRATGQRSSFHESLAPAWGLVEYWRATGEPAARQASLRTAGLFLEHRLFRSVGSGKVISGTWLTLHYPPIGTTTSCKRCSSSFGWVLQVTHDAPTRSRCLNAADARTVGGSPAAAGGSRPVRPAGASR